MMKDNGTLTHIGLNSLMSGMMFMLEKQLNEVNEARTMLGMPTIAMVQAQQVQDGQNGRGQRAHDGQADMPAIFGQRMIESGPKKRGRLKKAGDQPTATATLPVPENKKKLITQLSAAERRRRMETGKRLGATNRERWALVKEAGIAVASYSPTKDEIARAKKIIEARNYRAQKKATAPHHAAAAA